MATTSAEASTTSATTVGWLLRRFAGFVYSEQLPFAAPEFMCVSVAAYLAGIAMLSRWAHAHRAALPNVRPLSVAYNAAMVAVAFATSIAAFVALADRMRSHGIHGVFCEKAGALDGLLGASVYAYYLAKYAEFLDTVFLALKDRRVSWLHLYHHTTIVVFTWIWLHACVSMFVVIAAINSAVHVPMYAYYLACALGVPVPVSWKRKLTLLQIVQLCSGFAFGAVWFYFHIVERCSNVGFLEAGIGVAADALLVALFVNFYRQTYSIHRHKQFSQQKPAVTVDITAKQKEF